MTQKPFEYCDIQWREDETFTIGPIQGVPDISNPVPGQPAAWFLGPRAENQDILTRYQARLGNAC
jgi:hypothetical protein